MLTHRRRLAYQLVQSLLVDDSFAVLIGIRAVIGAGNLAVEQHTEADRFSAGTGTQYQVQVPRMESKHDASRRRVQHSFFRIDLPGSGQRPLIEIQGRGRHVVLDLVLHQPTRRPEILRASGADVCFRRLIMRFVRGSLNARSLGGFRSREATA